MTIKTLLQNPDIGATITCRGVSLYFDDSDSGVWVVTEKKQGARKSTEILRTESEARAAKCFAENV